MFDIGKSSIWMVYYGNTITLPSNAKHAIASYLVVVKMCNNHQLDCEFMYVLCNLV